MHWGLGVAPTEDAMIGWAEMELRAEQRRRRVVIRVALVQVVKVLLLLLLRGFPPVDLREQVLCTFPEVVIPELPSIGYDLLETLRKPSFKVHSKKRSMVQ